MLPPTSAHIQLAAGILEHAAHLFHALDRGGLAGGGGFRAGRAGGDEALDALILLGGEVADFPTSADTKKGGEPRPFSCPAAADQPFGLTSSGQ